MGQEALKSFGLYCDLVLFVFYVFWWITATALSVHNNHLIGIFFGYDQKQAHCVNTATTLVINGLNQDRVIYFHSANPTIRMQLTPIKWTFHSVVVRNINFLFVTCWW